MPGTWGSEGVKKVGQGSCILVKVHYFLPPVPGAGCNYSVV